MKSQYKLPSKLKIARIYSVSFCKGPVMTDLLRFSEESVGGIMGSLTPACAVAVIIVPINELMVSFGTRP